MLKLRRTRKSATPATVLPLRGHTMGIEQLDEATARQCMDAAGDMAVVERLDGRFVKVVVSETGVRGCRNLVRLAGGVGAALAMTGQAFADVYGATWVGDTRVVATAPVHRGRSVGRRVLGLLAFLGVCAAMYATILVVAIAGYAGTH